MINADVFDIDVLKEKYGLSYQVDFIVQAEMFVGIKGKRVLEIGGSLPKEIVMDKFGAKQWVCVEELQYYTDIGVNPPSYVELIGPLADAKDLPDYGTYSGRAEKIPESFSNKFDLICSIACFEHIDRLPLAMHRMYNSLKPGGKLFSMFSPIWSSFNGHHLHNVTDKSGQNHNFTFSPIPLWGHLLMSPPEMYHYLLDYTDQEAAAEIVYEVYHAPCINRLFTEDYDTIVKNSDFEKTQIIKYGNIGIPEQILATLLARHPGKANFDNHGLLFLLEKAE